MNRHPQKLISILFSVALSFFSTTVGQQRAVAAPTVSAQPSNMIVLSLSGDMFSQSRAYLSKLGIRVTCKQGYALWIASEPKNVWLVNPDNRTYLLMPFAAYAKDEQSEYGPNNCVFKDQPEMQALVGDNLKLRLRCYRNYLKGTNFKSPNFIKNKLKRRAAEVVYIDNQPIPLDVKKHWCNLIGVTGAEVQSLAPTEDRGLPVGLGRRVIKKWWGDKKFAGNSDKWVQIIELKAFANVPLDSKIYAKPVGYKLAKDKTSLYLSGDGNFKQKDIEDFFQRPL